MDVLSTVISFFAQFKKIMKEYTPLRGQSVKWVFMKIFSKATFWLFLTEGSYIYQLLLVPSIFLLQVEVNAHAGQRSAFMCQKIVFDTKQLGFRARATQKFRLNFCTFLK